jgi:hypothetical protein
LSLLALETIQQSFKNEWSLRSRWLTLRASGCTLADVRTRVATASHEVPKIKMFCA